MRLWAVRLVPFAVVMAFCVCGLSQTQVTQTTGSPATQDPTRPEIQPRIDIDRDPILSPDPPAPAGPSSSATANAPTNTGANQPQALEKNQNGMYVLHTDVDEVLLNCTVIDEKGQIVQDLNKNDFRVWEDGVPQTVNSVQRQDLPVSLGILVDNSGSMRDNRASVNQAAYNLLRVSNPRDEAFVVNFSDHAYLDQGFTSDLVALNKGLSRFDSKGTTAMYDAVAAAANELSTHAKLRKQALLIITDGADNASQLDLQQTIRRVQNLGGPVVYSVGLLFDTDKAESDRAQNALESLSRETGGVAYFPRSLNEVNAIAAEVAHELRDQYTVDYHASRPASLGGYRVVHVEARSPKYGTLIVRTRRGYYASPANNTPVAQETGR